jgi:fucose permease
MAAPMVIVPVFLSRWFGGVWSGRALLTSGLLLVASGILVIGLAANTAMYAPILAGMLIAGTGAGILNGETAKVAMTLIAPHRAGMAAGIGGTIRFSGVLIGFAGLGAILFQTVFAMLNAAIPESSYGALVNLTQQVVAGDQSSIEADRALIVQSLASAFRLLFLIAAALSFVTAIVTWVLVRVTDAPSIDLKSDADPIHCATLH